MAGTLNSQSTSSQPTSSLPGSRKKHHLIIIMVGHFLLPILGLCLITPARAGSLQRPDYYRRATPSVNTSISTPWSYLGCYIDTLFGTALNTDVTRDFSMTETKCVNYCGQRSYTYAGLEAGWECHCGNSLSATNTTASDCSTPCAGASGEACGGSFRLTVFKSSQAQPTVNGWNSLGCFSDGILFFRLLTGFEVISFNNNTVRNCLSTCDQKGYSYAGVEGGTQCFCGNKPSNPTQISSSLCGIQCSGNSSETCGGLLTLNLFNKTSGSGIHSYSYTCFPCQPVQKYSCLTALLRESERNLSTT